MRRRGWAPSSTATPSTSASSWTRAPRPTASSPRSPRAPPSNTRSRRCSRAITFARWSTSSARSGWSATPRNHSHELKSHAELKPAGSVHSQYARSPRGAILDGFAEVPEDGNGHVPAQAGVGDALAFDQVVRIAQILATVDQEALEHDADDAPLARRHLFADHLRDGGLAAVVLFTIAMAGVDHHARRH